MFVLPSTRDQGSGAADLKKAIVLITVTDSGIGLKAEDLSRLFETFYKTKADGMGMGLAISRSIVEAHGGRTWATTECRSRRHLPAHVASADLKRIMATAETIVLVIDDDPSFRRSTEMLIDSADLSVQVFSSAEEFLRCRRPEFLTKPFREQDLLDAIHRAINFDRAARLQRAKLGDLRGRHHSLTAREREVMARVVTGMLNKQVAHELGHHRKDY